MPSFLATSRCVWAVSYTHLTQAQRAVRHVMRAADGQQHVAWVERAGRARAAGPVSYTHLDLTGHDEVSVKPSTVYDKYYIYYTTGGVNLRSGPGTSYDKVTTCLLYTSRCV